MKRLAAAILTTLAVVVPATGALAAWSAGSTGSGSSKARSLPAAPGTPSAAPSPAANSGTVRVIFTTATFSGGTLSYAVSRYAAATGGSSLATTTCTTSPCDIAVSDGTWYFDVASALQNWRGTATTTRASAVVDTTAPAGLSITGVGASGNAETLSGSTGTATNDQSTVNVVVCATNAFPCATPEASSSRTITGGTWSWTTPGIGNKKAHYAQVSQSDAAGNQATAIFGPFTT